MPAVNLVERQANIQEQYIVYDCESKKNRPRLSSHLLSIG
jgi:hypothetical protein